MKKIISNHRKPSGLGIGDENLDGCYAPVDNEGNVLSAKKSILKMMNRTLRVGC